MEIDNNAAERALKNFAVGRRNWLFSKSILGAEASAIIYSVTETAMLHGLKPYNYLCHVLDAMRRNQNNTDHTFIDDLLPWSPRIPESCKTNVMAKK